MSIDTILIHIQDAPGSKHGRMLVYNKEDLGGSIHHAKMFVAEAANKSNLPIRIMQSKEILNEQGIEVYMKNVGDATKLGDVLEDTV